MDDFVTQSLNLAKIKWEGLRKGIFVARDQNVYGWSENKMHFLDGWMDGWMDVVVVCE